MLKATLIEFLGSTISWKRSPSITIYNWFCSACWPNLDLIHVQQTQGKMNFHLESPPLVSVHWRKSIRLLSSKTLQRVQQLLVNVVCLLVVGGQVAYSVVIGACLRETAAWCGLKWGEEERAGVLVSIKEKMLNSRTDHYTQTCDTLFIWKTTSAALNIILMFTSSKTIGILNNVN